MRRSALPRSTISRRIAMLTVLLSSVAWAGNAGKVLYRFPGGRHGNLPLAGVVFDDAGNMYGTTYDGGVYGWGTVFELSRSATGWKQLVLYSFMGSTDGANPAANLIFDSAGNLYGTTTAGGSSQCGDGCGTVFRLSLSNGMWRHTVLYSFAGTPSDGSGPVGLAMGAKMQLYGTTGAGGNNSQCSSGCGTVFALTPANGGWTETVLYSFAGYPDGDGPSSGVILDKAGNLYGETSAGGKTNGGTVFELSHSAKGWKEVLIYTFIQNQGDPLGGLVFDKTGSLYGATEFGPQEEGYGAIFRLTHSRSGWTESVLHAFGGADGLYPRSGVILDSIGNVYGTTAEGGSKNLGAVFELKYETWNESVLYSFLGNSEGDDPEASLTFGPNGNLYGTSSSELSRFYGGTVFEVKP